MASNRYLPDDELIDGAEVRRITDWSKTTLNEKIAEHKFLPPILLSPYRKRWIRREVIDWLAERVAERDAAQHRQGGDAV